MMSMYEEGMLAKAKAGHDCGNIYVIIRLSGEYVYLADGCLRTLDRPKKKNKKHIQVIHRKCNVQNITDIQIKRVIKDYLTERTVIKEEK